VSFLTILQIIIIYFVYVILVILGGYYVNLFQTKDQFTKDELKDVSPYLKEVMNALVSNYSSSKLIVIMIAASFFGIVIPFITFHWIINSSLLVIIVFFGLPFMKRSYEQSQVTDSENYGDLAMNVIVKYSEIIILGFGAGYGTGLIYNWGSLKVINFIWFLINIVAISILLGITIRNIILPEESPEL